MRNWIITRGQNFHRGLNYRILAWLVVLTDEGADRLSLWTAIRSINIRGLRQRELNRDILDRLDGLENPAPVVLPVKNVETRFGERGRGDGFGGGVGGDGILGGRGRSRQRIPNTERSI